MLRAFRILFANELLTMLRAPANIFFIFLFPMFFLGIMLFSYGSSGTVGPVTVEIVDQDHSGLAGDYLGRVRKLFKAGTIITGEVVDGNPAQPLASGRLRLTVPPGFEKAVLSGGDTKVRLEYNAANSMVTQIATKVFDPLTLHFNVDVTQEPTPVHVEYRNATGLPSIEFPQYLVTGILVMSIMSTGVFTTALVVAVRREQNTFKLMSCMPLGAGSVLLAIVAARGLVIVLASLILLMVAVYGFGLSVPIDTFRLLNATGVIVVGGLTLLALGLMASARLSTVQGAIFVGNLIYIILLFLSDLAVPMRSLSSGPMHWLAYLPTAQFVTALRAVLVQGKSVGEQWLPLLAMLAWAAAFLAVARLTFRWHRA